MQTDGSETTEIAGWSEVTLNRALPKRETVYQGRRIPLKIDKVMFGQTFYKHLQFTVRMHWTSLNLNIYETSEAFHLIQRTDDEDML